MLAAMDELAGERRCCSARATPSRAEGLLRAAAGRRRRVQAARGLGHDAGRDRRVPARWPTTPGVQVAIHTDTLNEAGFLESTLEAIAGRPIHAYHTEGAGGGHAPDIIRIASHPERAAVVDEPDTPAHESTRVDEHLDMLMVCHHLNPRVPEDLAFAESRIRPSTIAAEDVLHDLGAISMIGSDSQAMGRVGETIIRTWQTAHVDEGAARVAGRRRRGPTTRGRGATSPSTRSARRSRTGSTGEIGSVEAGQAGRPRALGAALLRRPAARGAEGRGDRVGARWATRTPRSRRRSRCSPRPMFARARARGRRRPRSRSSRPRRWRRGLAERLGLRRALRRGRGHAPR